MFRVFQIATLAAFAHIVEGHVRALPTGASGFGCRDCNGKATPGPFRVNGPIGANNKQFGANGSPKVAEGQSVELKIGYNGGHRSQTLNYFNVRYACGAPANNANTFRKVGDTNKDNINCNLPCKQLKYDQIEEVDGVKATQTNYPVDARQSRQSGYSVKFKIPKIEGAGDQRKCTFVLVEGRDWGAAWDFDVQPANAPAPPTTTTPPPSSLAGTFKFTTQNCQKADSPGCTCLGGEITVQHTPGAAEAKALVKIANYPPQIVTLKQPNPGAYSTNYVLSRCGTGDQELDITLAPNGQTSKSILNVGVIADKPTLCGSIVPVSAQTSPWSQPPAIPNCGTCTNTADWKDKDGDNCGQYSSCNGGAWRTLEKGLGFYKKYANSDGKSARDACCACGGGSTKVYPVIPTPPTTPGLPTATGTGPTTTNNNGNSGITRKNDMYGDAVEDDAAGMGVTLGAVLTVFAGILV